MKLQELLKQITPLPYSDDGSNIVSGDDTVFVNPRSGSDKKWIQQGYLTIQYAKHACNVLPEMVEALKDAVEFLSPRNTMADLNRGSDAGHLYRRLSSAITKAENIN